MSIAKVIEISTESTESFEAAIRSGLEKCAETVSGIRGAWVQDQQVVVENDAVVLYRVDLKVTFVLA